MATPHENKYRFNPPETIREAKERMLILLRDIWNIEKQRGDAVRYTREGVELTPEEFQNWRSRISASHVFKKTEYQELKHWIKERRRELDAKEAQIEDPNNPRELLLLAKQVLDQILAGNLDPDKIGRAFSVIEQYLVHAA